MNCKLCSQNFNLQNPKKHPRVLIECGHTFCEQCIRLNLDQNKGILCKECGKCSFLKDGSNFPLNETLLRILKKNEEGLCEFIKEFQICKIHGKKLQGYCESDQQSLCLNCILGQHKSHKVVSIGQKVQKQKQILVGCEQEIFKSTQTLKKIEDQCQYMRDRLQLDMNQYLFQINLLTKNIINQLKEIEQNFILETKRNIEKSIQTIQTIHQVVKEKKKFYHQLKNIQIQLLCKSGVEFLNENNKKVFIIQNSTLKQKFVLPYHKYNLQKEKVLNQIIKSIQQVISFEKKKSSISHDSNNKTNNMKPPSSTNATKNPNKNLKDECNPNNIQESPNKLQKKNANSIQKINKQPQILEVNLLQKYEKHQQDKNMKKRNSQLQIQAKGKSPKIEYQIRKQVQLLERNGAKKSGNQGNKFNQGIKNRIPCFKAQFSNKYFQISGRTGQSSGRLRKNADRVLNESKPNMNNSEELMDNSDQLMENYEVLKMSLLNQTINLSSSYNICNQNPNKIRSQASDEVSKQIPNVICGQSPKKICKQIPNLICKQIPSLICGQSPNRIWNQSEIFEVETPVSINSFMESSRFTISNDKKENSILKNSRDQFSLLCLQQKIYHFGGLKNDSISCQKIIPNFSCTLNLSNQILMEGIYRSKAQCVIMKNYNPKKCLILGGKDHNGQRSNSIYQFDIENNKLKKSHLQLHEPISGFGAVVYQNKLYIFGGSSNSALKTLHEYQLGKNGFQIKKMSSMTNSRDELGFALGFDGYLYVAGGINSSNTILNSCERYSFKTKKWSSIPAMKNPRRSFTMASLPNGLFAIGGHDGKYFISSVEMYDLQLDNWVQVAGLNEGRFTHTSVSTNDYQHIIVFGGFQSEPLKSIQVYNTLQNRWTLQNQMDRERYLHCSIMIQH